MKLSNVLQRVVFTGLLLAVFSPIAHAVGPLNSSSTSSTSVSSWGGWLDSDTEYDPLKSRATSSIAWNNGLVTTKVIDNNPNGGRSHIQNDLSHFPDGGQVSCSSIAEASYSEVGNISYTSGGFFVHIKRPANSNGWAQAHGSQSIGDFSLIYTFVFDSEGNDEEQIGYVTWTLYEGNSVVDNGVDPLTQAGSISQAMIYKEVNIQPYSPNYDLYVRGDAFSVGSSRFDVDATIFID